MKYMTKEWYESMKKAGIPFSFQVSKKAQTFSEAYFKELYAQEEKEFISRYSFSSVDENAAKKDFIQLVRSKIALLKKNLPPEILCNVADIRVLALGVACAKIKKEIEKNLKENNKSVHEAEKAYWRQYQMTFKGNPPSFWEELRLHDCKLASCRKKGNDVVLIIDPTNGIDKPDIRQVILKDCTVLKQDAPLHGSFFLYDEIYRSGEQYEIHFLLAGKQLKDFIVTVRDVEIYSDVE